MKILGFRFQKSNPAVTLTDYVIATLFKEIDWGRVQIPGEGFQPGCPLELAHSITQRGLIMGGVIGAQFPEKIYPIFKEIYGEDAQTKFNADENQISQEIATKDEQNSISTELDDIGALNSVINNLRNGNVNLVSQKQATRLVFSYFLYGCSFGAFQRDFFLKLLINFVENQNLLFRSLADAGIQFPREFVDEESLEDILEMARELVQSYESEYGPLDTLQSRV